jgi:hypothetical protein
MVLLFVEVGDFDGGGAIEKLPKDSLSLFGVVGDLVAGGGFKKNES